MSKKSVSKFDYASMDLGDVPPDNAKIIVPKISEDGKSFTLAVRGKPSLSATFSTEDFNHHPIAAAKGVVEKIANTVTSKGKTLTIQERYDAAIAEAERLQESADWNAGKAPAGPMDAAKLQRELDKRKASREELEEMQKLILAKLAEQA